MRDVDVVGQVEDLERLRLHHEKMRNASQWVLMWRRFERHKLALVALVVLSILYTMAIFAEFIAPQDPHHIDKTSIRIPPHALHIVHDGKFMFRPFVYGYTRTIDTVRFERVYVLDKEQRYPIRFFVRGDEYKMWGLFRSNIHLFGTEGARIYLWGTDNLGKDLLSRIIYGTRISLSVGLVGVAMSLVIGILLGGISGYFGGAVDTAIQRVIEFLRSIPTIPLWMGLSAAVPEDWSVVQTYFAITIILSIVGWTGLARVVRGKFLSLKNEEFVLASRSAGAGSWWIITRHLVPSFLGYIIVQVTLAVPGMILGETALSFLGLGLKPPAISWGVLLKSAQQISVVATYPWLLIVAPFIIVTVLSFNFLGDAIRDAADPYESRRL